MKKLWFVGLITGLLFSQAYANPALSGNKHKKTGGFYANVQVGQVKIKVDKIPLYTITSGGISARLSGGYMFDIAPTFKLGAELGYQRNPKTVIGIDGVDYFNYSGYQIDVLGNAVYNFTDKFYGIAKVGFSSVHQKLTATGTYDSESRSRTATKILGAVSLGAGYLITHQLGIELSYSTTIGGQTPLFNDDAHSIDRTNSVTNVDSMMLGLTYSF